MDTGEQGAEPILLLYVGWLCEAEGPAFVYICGPIMHGGPC